MNLSPEWTNVLIRHGHQAVHWSSVGDPRAADEIIMRWAREKGSIVLTHDLDFGTALALTRANGPSVVQVRTSNPLPEVVAPHLLQVLASHAADLLNGALIVLDKQNARIRILPL